MNCGHCKDCKWWERWERHALLDSEEFWGTCTLFETVGGIPVHPDRLASTFDSEEEHASFHTHETFGCVEFTPKEP